MTNCTTDDDCAVAAAAASWCTLSASCDTVLGTCVTWPRCRTAPWLGCSNRSQQCVHTGLEPVAEVVVEAGEPLSTGLVVAILLVILVGSFVVLGGGYVYYAYRHRRSEKIVAEEIEHMDKPLVSATATIHHRE